MTIIRPGVPISGLELTLAVPDLRRAVRFYRLLFGAEPADVRAGMVRFEPRSPGVDLTLRRGSADTPAQVRFCTDAAGLARARDRLSRGGVATVESGLVRASRLPREIAVRDPAGHQWRICVAQLSAGRRALWRLRVTHDARSAADAVRRFVRAGAVDRAFAQESWRAEQTLRRGGAWS